jgi:starch-binding outer membrane protein, SusD/RagB family
VVLATIFAERDLELMLTDFGLHFKDMRRKGALQKGTLLHFPVPATELGTIGRALYTFGGVNNTNSGTADGVGAWYTSP